MIDCIILTKNANTLLKTCITSFIKYHSNINICFNIGDTGTPKNELNQLIDYLNENKIKFNLFDNLEYNFAKNCNYIVDKIKNNNTNILLFLNDDVEFVMPVIDIMSVLISNNNIGTIGCKLLFDNDKKIIQHCGQFIIPFSNERGWEAGHYGFNQYYNILTNNIYKVEGNTGACLMINKHLFLKLSGFNINYKTCYEDVELNLNCLTNNKINICIGNKYALHKESVTRKIIQNNIIDSNDYILLSNFLNKNKSKIWNNY